MARKLLVSLLPLCTHGFLDSTCTSFVVGKGTPRTTGIVASMTSRRSALLTGAAAGGASLLRPFATLAASPEESVAAEIKDIVSALDLPKLNAFLDEEKWDNVRDVLKAPPVGNAWQQSQAKKNPLRKLADLRDDVELFEVVDEIAAALQLADQYCYSNTFIYTQPGNGKVKIKEPKQQLKIAVDKISAFN